MSKKMPISYEAILQLIPHEAEHAISMNSLARLLETDAHYVRGMIPRTGGERG